jgi:hypothetical protein
LPREARDKWKERLILKTPAAFVGFNEDPAPGVGKYCECDTGAAVGEPSTGGIPEQILVSKDIVYGSAVNRKPTFGAKETVSVLCSLLMKNGNGHLPRQARDDKHKEKSTQIDQ